MKKIYSTFVALFVFTQLLDAQLNCANPIPFYSSASYSYNFDSLHTNTDPLVDYGCNADPDHPFWFTLKVCQGGNAVLNLMSGTGVDVDFVVWGPYSSPAGCDTSLATVFDCSFSTSTSETINFPSTNIGEYYKMVVTTKYDGSFGDFFLYQSSGSAIFSDSSSCGSSLDSACSSIVTHQICHVTTDHTINKNIIIWDKITTYPIANYIIEKETTTLGVFSPIEIISPTDTSAQIDSITNPMIHADRYRLCVTDTCGFVYCSYPHQNIHLQTTSSMLGYPQLNWNDYDGFPYYTYYIFRGSSSSSLTLYDSLASSSSAYTDYSPLSGMNYYSVGVKPSIPCSPSRLMSQISYSNVANANFIGIKEIDLTNFVKVYPNPSNGIFNIDFLKPDNYTVLITDLSGKLLEKIEINESRNTQLNLLHLENGNYFIQIKSKNSTSNRKVTVLK